MSVGQTIIGLIVSNKLRVKLQLLEFPEISVAVNVITVSLKTSVPTVGDCVTIGILSQLSVRLTLFV